MAYIKKQAKEILDYLDKNPVDNLGWNKFVDKWKSYLIIKSKGICNCLKCGNQFTSSKKIDERVKCPKCREYSILKTDRLCNFQFNDILSIITKVKNTFVMRTYVINSYLSNNKMEFHLTEWGRTIIYPDSKTEVFLSSALSINMGFYSFNHFEKVESITWRKSIYSEIQLSYQLYMGNHNSLFNHIKYCGLNNLKRISIQSKLVAELSKTSILEFLVKNGFQTLAIEFKEYHKKSFKDYGFNKHDLQFLITFKEIDWRRFEFYCKYRVKSKAVINRLVYMDYNFDHIAQFMKLDLEELYKYDFSNMQCHDYIDYIRWCHELGFDLTDKKVLYPKNLKKEHDKLYKKIKFNESKKIQEGIIARYEKLSKNIYKNKKYIIYPAASIEDLKDESKQQKHCVRDYAERYANGKVDIYFMRLKSNVNKSLVTVSIINNHIDQKRIKGNEPTTEEQNRFLKKWEDGVLNRKHGQALL